MKLSVPYYSQFIDTQDTFWMLRACGITCFKMVVEFYGKETEDIVTLCKEAELRGGYHMTNGWVHDYLVAKAGECGLQARREEGLESLNLLEQSLINGNPVIVSVEKRVLEQTRFHMIVLVGYENDTFLYHEPESTDKEKGKFHTCTKSQLMDYWRGKAIFITL